MIVHYDLFLALRASQLFAYRIATAFVYLCQLFIRIVGEFIERHANVTSMRSHVIMQLSFQASVLIVVELRRHRELTLNGRRQDLHKLGFGILELNPKT